MDKVVFGPILCSSGGRFWGPFLGFIESHFLGPRQDDPHGLRNQQIPSP
jgi:hypothetical protein